MRPECGFYTDDLDTFFVDRLGAIWHIDKRGEPLDGGAPRRIGALPGGQARLHPSIVEERLWQLVACCPQIAWKLDSAEWGRFGVGAATRELSTEAASSFWDLIGDDDALF